MPAKWQQWMPFHIDRFFGSPAVQAMAPACQMGYLRLLTSCWQSEDCAVSSDPLDLAEKSGLGDELWATHGPRILRKFEAIDGSERLRNAICFAEWEKAKASYGKRAAAAEKTNSVRVPTQSVAVSEDKTIGDRAVTVSGRVGVNVSVSSQMNHVDVARAVGERCGITSPRVWQAIEAQARIEITDGRTVQDVAEEMVTSWQNYQTAKPKLNAPPGAEKFFGEGMWRDQSTWNWKDSPARTIPSAASYAAADDEYAREERRGYEMWLGMNEAYKAANPWKGEIPTCAEVARKAN
jgi:hypothetical protein